MHKLNLKLYSLLISIFLLLNLSCEDDYPIIFENNNSYSLTLSHNVVNGEKDYNDSGVFDRSEIIATLNLISPNGNIIEPSANSQITFEVSFNPSTGLNPSLTHMDGTPLTNNSAMTDQYGRVVLNWNDAGYFGEVTVSCKFSTADYDWVPENGSLTFEVFSVYDKVTDLSPISQDLADVQFTTGTIWTNPIIAVVRQEETVVPNIDVNLTENISINGISYITQDLDFLYFTDASGITVYSAQSDSTGQSVFNINLIGGDELNSKLQNNELLIEQDIFIEDENLSSSIDFNNNGVPDLSGSISLRINTSTANSFSLVDTLLLEIDPVQFIIDDTPTAINNGGNNNENFGDESNSDSDADDNSSTNSSDDNALLIATVRDINGSGIAGIPVRFSNSDIYGTFTTNNVISGDDGTSQTTLQNIVVPASNQIYDMTLTADILDPNDSNQILKTASQNFQIGYQSALNISQVDIQGGLDVALIQNFTTVNNVSVQYSDTIKVNVVDSNGAPVENVPIQFSLLPNSDGDIVGMISSQQEWSDSDGSAMIAFELTPGDLVTYAGQTINPVINIYINDDLQETTNNQWTINIEGYPNIEYDVHEFNFYSNLLPDSTPSISMAAGDTLILPFIAKDASGIAIEGVPVQFQIYDSEVVGRAYGLLADALTYTCCTDTSAVYADVDANGVATPEENIGIAFTNYYNIITEASTRDKVRAFITDPITNEILFQDEVTITVELPSDQTEASLQLTSEYYQLPANDNSIFTSTITASVIDSLENPVPENTLVQFQSLTLDDNGDLVSIGSIEENKFTDSQGTATSIFNMESDAGLAVIIGTAPQYNLADTIYVNLTSTQASSIELTPPFPFEIMVQGGGGVEATGLEVRVKDATENLVTSPFIVRYQILPTAPQGVYLNASDENNYLECIEATNGVATATLNSGTQPGSVPVKIELFNTVDGQELTDDFCQSLVYGDPDDPNNGTGLAALEAVPVTVVTGPPEFGQINYSYVDITPIGGGTYNVPLSVNLWDFYSNPVADSTNVYIWIEGIAAPWDGENVTYEFGDTVKWGGTDALGNVIEVDSLLYIYNLDNADDFYGNIGPGDNPIVFGNPMWRQVPQPGSIIGEAQIGMEAPDGNSYPGLAWSSVNYGTSNMFDNTVIKALTYKANGEKLIIDGRDSHNGEGLVLPFQPGVLALGSDVQFWNYSVFGDPGINDLDDTVAVNISASLTDYYQYPVDNGRVVLSAPGANIWAVCDPVDTDNDGFVGCCDSFDVLDNNTGLPSGNAGNGDGVCDEISEFDTCSVCVANGGTWIPDGAQDNPATFQPEINGPNDVADDTAYGRTNGDGTIIWNISYSEALNPGDAQNPETYEDFTSTVTGQLIDPLQTASEGVDILLIKSEVNENP